MTQNLISLRKGVAIKILDELFTISDQTIQPGDIIFDRRDGSYGICDDVYGDKLTIKESEVAEVGVLISNCYRLTPFNISNN